MIRTVLVSSLVVAACSSGRRSAAPETSGARWHPPIELASGGGTRGEWRQNNSDYDYVDDTTVAVTPDGTPVVAWVDQERKDIFVQRLEGGVPGPAVNLSRSPDVFSWLPRIAVAGDDIYVLWQEIVFSGGSHGGEAFFARSRDGGRTFEAPLNLSRSQSGDGKGKISDDVWHNGSLDLVVASDATIHAAWTEFDGPLWLATSHDAGATFARPRRLDDGSHAARAPTLAADGDHVFVAWTAGDDPAADLHLRVSTDRGDTFAPVQRIARTPGYSDAPKLAVDAAGVLHLAWAESRGGPFERFAVYYARSTDRGATFTGAREVSRCPPPESCAFPMLAVDRERVVITWERARSPREQPRGVSMIVSRDGGATFSAPSLVAGSIDPGGGTNGSHQGRLMEKLALAGDEIWLGMSALAHGRGSRTWVVRGTFEDGQRITSRQRQQPTR